MEVLLLNKKINILGKRLRGLREDKDLKQNKVATDLSITPYQLSRYESGNSKPDPELIAEFATYYEVTTDYLLGHSDQPHLTEEEAFEAFKNDPSLERWYKELPKSKEEDLQRLRKMWEIFKGEE